MAINSSDFNPASLSGTVTVNSTAGTSSTIMVADQTTEGPEKFVIKLRTGGISGPVVATTASLITINDTSTNAVVPPVEPPVEPPVTPDPTYSLQANVASVSEGQAVKITLVTTNLSNGNVVPYAISGVSSADIGGASLSGSFTVNNNTASVDLAITADLATEGTETLTLRLTSAPTNPSVPVTVVDSSVAPPVPIATYELTNAVFGSTPATTTTVNEGTNNVIFYLSITNGGSLWGTDVPYTITGVSGTDIGSSTDAILTQGKFQIPATPQANPVATVAFNITADQTTEGTETMTLTLNGKNVSSSVIINDTSTTPALPPTYDLSYTQTRIGGTTVRNVDETTPTSGTDPSIAFILVTTNVVPGTSIPFTVTGIQQSDITSTGLTWDAANSRFTGAFTMLNADPSYGVPLNTQVGRVNVEVVADSLTEGTEVITLALTNGQRSIGINILDTSLSPPPAYTLTPAASSVNEGSSLTFTAGGTNIVNGTYYWTIVGAGAQQTDYGAAAGQFTITNNSGTFSVSIVADLITEGAETFTVLLRTGSISGPVVATSSAVTINDSSTTPVVTGSATITAANTRAVVFPNTLPAAATWVAFRVIGAGGSGAGPDGQAGGSGGGAQYARGIVKLPATSGPKVLYGFAGRPARGGTASGRAYDLGGFGENCSPGVDASGAQGEINGPAGASGEGGGGGGASSLYYQTPDGTYVPIVTVGGGGGGGGGSNRTSGYGNANGENKGFLTFGGGITGETVAPGLKAEWCRLDGGGGGGGGGAAGAPGYCGDDGNDNPRVSKGGSAGYVVRNDSNGHVWSTFDWYGIGPVPPSTEGVAADAPQPYPWVTFGRGGTGGLGGTSYGQGGQMGAIAAYWTTAATAPDYSNVPAWAYPVVTIPGSVLANRDMQASSASAVTFYSWGSVSYNIDGNISTSCFIMSDWGNDPINGIGEFLEIRITSAAPSNGLARGALNSNIVENTWTPLKPMGPFGYYITSTESYLDVTVSIRRRDNQAVLRTVTYYNLTQPLPYSGGGGY
jgi:hypothetical protein